MRKRLLHEAAQLFRHLGVDLEPDHRSPPAPLQRGLEHANQIFRLFLDFEFGVADDAECALALDGVAGKQPADEQAGGLFQRDQVHRAVLGRGMRMKRSILPGMRISAFIGLPSDTRCQLQRDGEAEARDERERVRRIDRKRRQQREDVVEEMILQPGPLRLGEVVAVDQHDAGLRQDGAQIAPDRLLVGGKFGNRLVDEDELLGRRQAVGAAFGDAFADLRLDAGDADHEELIKVIGGNRQESHPLQRGMAGIDRLFEHPAVEMQPGKLTVNESLGARRDRRRDFGDRFFFLDFNNLCRFHKASIHLERGGGLL